MTQENILCICGNMGQQFLYSVCLLDASLPAVSLYEHRGYKTVGHGVYELENDVKLVYEIMEKKLKADYQKPSEEGKNDL